MICEVAILGAGPAGLSAAATLRARGIGDIVVIEREEVPGGVPRHCGHPAFGLREFHRLLSGPAYARHLAAAASGIEIRCRCSVTAIEPGGRLVRTTSPFADGNRVTLVDVDFDKAVADPDLVTKLQSPKTAEEVKAAVTSLPGVKITLDPEISITFTPQ